MSYVYPSLQDVDIKIPSQLRENRYCVSFDHDLPGDRSIRLHQSGSRFALGSAPPNFFGQSAPTLGYGGWHRREIRRRRSDRLSCLLSKKIPLNATVPVCNTQRHNRVYPSPQPVDSAHLVPCMLCQRQGDLCNRYRA